MSMSSLSPGTKIGPRKALFFEIVESGLDDRFEKEEISRIGRFCQSAKLEVPYPKPLGNMHDPCEEFVEGLTAKPWWDAGDFAWSEQLEAQSAQISAELKKVLAEQELFKGDSRFQKTMGEGWTALRLQRLGEWNKANVALFPITTKIVQSLDIPLAVRGVMFAKQSPGSGVQPHSDGRNFILTAHLGLAVPKECWISVAGERRPWAEDKLIVFDTSFTHETGNESEQDRYVLIIDFWHPELMPKEREALKFIYDCRNKYDSDRAGEIECTYIEEGGTTDVKEYINSKRSFGDNLARLFSGGGLVKFNPFE
eukprot:CAMPEP_0173203708 /NCGR_PEP_ID=MMETSP1141-20130122/19679_1 /TAXON_ID=483371 /ORGANISM="non described non described, Strain CCMP2298" /LENGTH=310 /DNA_ID=CAMNT_0014129215 /DNA_START=117 /DNA_END=1049 /DNA_ORIENTATION=+